MTKWNAGFALRKEVTQVFENIINFNDHSKAVLTDTFEELGAKISQTPEAALIEKVFFHIDSNNDGSICKSEIRAALKDQGLNVGDNE